VPAISAPEDTVPIVDRLTLLFQARIEWVIAESLGLPSPLDRGSDRRPARRIRFIPWQWFSSN
jgi:hypothetical protein